MRSQTGGCNKKHYTLRMSPRRVGVVLLLALTCFSGCTDRKKKMQEAQRVRDAEKKAFEDAKEAKRIAVIPKIEPAKLDPFWDAPDSLRAYNGKPCPEGLWALFPETPGEGAVKEANEAKRAALAEKVRASTFVAVIHSGAGLEVRPYNKKKKRLTVEVDGLLECTDGLGVVSLAWGDPAKPFRQAQPGDEDDELPPTSVWRAQPRVFQLPFATAAEAKKFVDETVVSLDARLVFTLGKVAVDVKKHKTPPGVASPEQAMVDYGAGRLVHVTLVGARLAADHEKAELAVQKK